MADVELIFAGGDTPLHATKVTGAERVGEPMTLEIDAVSTEPVKGADYVGRRGAVVVRASTGERVLSGIVTRFGAIATAQAEGSRRYRLTLRSLVAPLELRRRSYVFQKLSVPDIVKKVLADAGHPPDLFRAAVQGSHAPREYVVQYAETDAAFIRRMCEEEGLYYRFESGGGDAAFVLEDTSPSAPKAPCGEIAVVDATALRSDVPAAYRCRRSLRARPGKVTLRDYNPEKPAVKLEGTKTAARGVEDGVEVYEAPGRFADQGAAGARAGVRLESLRHDAETWTFDSNAIDLAPGLSVKMSCAPDYAGSAQPDGDYFVVGVRHRWSTASDWILEVEAVPLSAPYRLPKVTPRPRIAGVHNAFVTTAPGEEITVDKDGRVRLHFPWDREGPTDDKSSLPVRVMQPNTPGSMAIPRGGWEVMVAFEDGDPDRPYVLGRVYNAKQVPPYSLPANKTVSSLGTYSSPGGGKRNVINMDDAAGRQNLAFLAGFGKAAAVANNMVTQTVKNEDATVGGSQTRTVGAKETVSVTQAFLNSLGSQSATVGGMQKVFVKGDYTVGVGPETVIIGAACLEKVGNPVSGLKNLATAAALQGAGALGKAGGLITTGIGLAQAGIQGYQRGGLAGAAAGVGMAGAGMAAGALMPGGDLLVGALGSGGSAPWSESKNTKGEQASGGGATGGSDAAGAKGPGPGHRNTIVSGAYTELIGAACSATSPGTIGWTTIGASTFLVGGSHSIKAGATAGTKTLGAATEVLGSLSIKTAANLCREVKGPINTTIGGALSSKAGGQHSIKAGAALSIKIAGPLTMTGSKVTFVVGDSKVSASPGGVLIETPSFKVTGSTKQPGIAHSP
jgi:type VI secretion system secreted protein VgrG